MTNSLSCETEKDVTINTLPQKLNVKVISWTHQNICCYALENIFNNHFIKQNVTFDSLHL
jgi:hypothetical protein